MNDYIININNNFKKDYWFCYILKSCNPLYLNKTYIGATNNPFKRLYNHNNTKSGAKSTKNMRPSEMICLFEGLNKIEALKLEWLLKHPERKKK
jgi:predicted GIY-YIG superfamily endonuclease